MKNQWKRYYRKLLYYSFVCVYEFSTFGSIHRQKLNMVSNNIKFNKKYISYESPLFCYIYNFISSKYRFYVLAHELGHWYKKNKKGIIERVKKSFNQKQADKNAIDIINFITNKDLRKDYRKTIAIIKNKKLAVI